MGAMKSFYANRCQKRSCYLPVVLELVINWRRASALHKSISSMNLISVARPPLYGIAPVRGESLVLRERVKGNGEGGSC